MSTRKLLGYILFQIDGGIVQDTEVELITNRARAVRVAVSYLETKRKNDRYANTEHLQYDPEFAEQTASEYQERLESAENLHGFPIKEGNDFVVLEVYAEPETSPVTM